MKSLPDLLAELLWVEGKFPSGGGRTSHLRCRQIVNSAITRLANTEGRRT